jgi:hypothetical protein
MVWRELVRPALVATLMGASSVAAAFDINGRWTNTATNGATAPIGQPVTLTWSIVPDGTPVSSESNSPSSLVQFLDNMFGSGGGGPMATRPWFSLLQRSFDRWNALGGLQFVYSAADDGAVHGTSPGVLGVRGDLRLAGDFVDGAGGTYAYTSFINAGGDMVFDTADAGYFGSSGLDFRNFRNTFMHEVGHALGLGHVESSNADFLMEVFPNNAFDGPQFDDLRGVQHLYGDVNEKAGGGVGNNTASTATPLGALPPGTSVRRGDDASTGTVVGASETDFVSIANASDVDFYSFTIASPVVLDASLTPLGASYNQRTSVSQPFVTLQTNRSSNLALELHRGPATNPTLVAASTAGGLGVAETLAAIPLATPGEYFVRVTGSTAVVQFYGLVLTASALNLQGDYNSDGVIDAGDYTVWRDTLGSTTQLAADGSANGVVDAADYDVWNQSYGNTLGPAAAVPEPAASILAALALVVRWLGASARVEYSR